MRLFVYRNHDIRIPHRRNGGSAIFCRLCSVLGNSNEPHVARMASAAVRRRDGFVVRGHRMRRFRGHVQLCILCVNRRANGEREVVSGRRRTTRRRGALGVCALRGRSDQRRRKLDDATETKNCRRKAFRYSIREFGIMRIGDGGWRMRPTYPMASRGT